MKNLSTKEVRKIETMARALPRGENPQQAFDAVFRKHRVVGGTVTLARRDGTLETFAYGNARLAPDVPALPDTIYRVASVSKLVCALGAMALVERGMLALDADIGETLGYPVRNPAYPNAPITLRQLLTHTAGLLDGPEYDGPGISGKLTLRQMLSAPHAARNFHPHRAPGRVFQYSNFGAGIVGSLMEAATRKRFDDTVQSAVFAPLGITGSFVPQRMLEHSDRLACGYAVKPLRLRRLAYDAPNLVTAPLADFDPERDFMHAPGRLLISMPDLSRIARLLCTDGALDGVRVLSPRSMAELLAAQNRRGSVGGDAGRGLGVAFAPEVFGRARTFGHQGVAYGMNAELWADPDTGDAVVMATCGGSLASVGKLIRCGWAVTRLGFERLAGGE